MRGISVVFQLKKPNVKTQIDVFFSIKLNRWLSTPMANNTNRASVIMHQSISAAPSAPPPPGGYCGAFARLGSPEGGAFANFVLPGGRANPELLTRTRFPVRIQLHKGFYWKNKGIGSFVKNRKQLKRFSLFIKPELQGNGAIDVNQRFLVIESTFC